MSFPSSAMDTYRKMYPKDLGKSHGKFKVGQNVKWKKTNSVVQRVWGKPAGKIIEIRQGNSGPLIVTAGSIRRTGKPHVVLAVKKGNGIDFGKTGDFVPVTTKKIKKKEK